MTNSKIVLGVVAGISVGIIAGMLLSPEKGADIRKKMLERTGDLGNALKDAFVDFINGEKDNAAATATTASNDMRLNTMG